VAIDNLGITAMTSIAAVDNFGRCDTAYFSGKKNRHLFSLSSSASTSGYFWPFWLFSIRLAMWPWPGHLREFVIFFENTQNYLKNQKKTFRIY
jgi:hypothetical protein